MDTYEEYFKVIIVHPNLHFFYFVYVRYLSIASYLYRKQIKSKLGNKLFFMNDFLCVHLNMRNMPECRTRILNVKQLHFWLNFTLRANFLIDMFLM